MPTRRGRRERGGRGGGAGSTALVRLLTQPARADRPTGQPDPDFVLSSGAGGRGAESRTSPLAPTFPQRSLCSKGERPNSTARWGAPPPPSAPLLQASRLQVTCALGHELFGDGGLPAQFHFSLHEETCHGSWNLCHPQTEGLPRRTVWDEETAQRARPSPADGVDTTCQRDEQPATWEPPLPGDGPGRATLSPPRTSGAFSESLL